MLNAFLNKAYFINMYKHTNRASRTIKELSRIGIGAERFQAIRHEHGRTGCRLSHQAIIRIAKENNMDRVAIFEDDIIFTDNTLEILEKAISQLPLDWDLLYFGCIWGTKEPYTENLTRIISCKLGHAVVFNKPTYDIILASTEKSMDRTNLLIHPRGKSFCTFPMVCEQEDKRICRKM